MAADSPWFDTTEEEQAYSHRQYELKLMAKWPKMQELEQEYQYALEEHFHQGIALDRLKEERDLLRKLYGIDNDKT